MKTLNDLFNDAEQLHNQLTEYTAREAKDELEENFYEIAADVSENRQAFSADIRALMKTLMKAGDLMSALDCCRVAHKNRQGG